MGKYFGGEALGTKRQICLMITMRVGDQALSSGPRQCCSFTKIAAPRFGFTPPSPGWTPGATCLCVAVCSAGRDLVSAFERATVHRDFEERIPWDSHIAVEPLAIIQLDDCLTRDEFALWVNDFSLCGRGTHSGPNLIALVAFYHVYKATAETSRLSTSGAPRSVLPGALLDVAGVNSC